MIVWVYVSPPFVVGYVVTVGTSTYVVFTILDMRGQNGVSAGYPHTIMDPPVEKIAKIRYRKDGEVAVPESAR